MFDGEIVEVTASIQVKSAVGLFEAAAGPIVDFYKALKRKFWSG